MSAPQAKPQPKYIPVGFTLPHGTQSNAKNLVKPGYVIDQSAEPWATCCKDPWTNYPPAENNDRFYVLLRQRYGEPKPPGPVPEYGQTAMHITDFQSALQTIAQQDPGWFKQQGYGPGPARPKADETIFPTETESHDAQYASNICKAVLDRATELGLSGGAK